MLNKEIRLPVPIGASLAVIVGLLLAALTLGVGEANAAKKQAKKSGSFTIVTKGLDSVPSNRNIGVRVWQIGEMAKGQRRVRQSVRRKGKTVLKGLPLGSYQVRVPVLMVSGLRFRPAWGTRTFRLTARKPRRKVELSYESEQVGPSAFTLDFNLAGAIGLVTTESSSKTALRTGGRNTSGSNLMALLPSGQLRDAIETTGSNFGPPIRINQFTVGPDGSVYVILQNPVYLGSASGPGEAPSQCVLFKVDRASGEDTCVDSGLQQVNIWSGGFGARVEPVQFDSRGSVYYLGYKWSSGGGMPETVLRRKNQDGTIADLLPMPNIYLNDFRVSPAGAVLMKGNLMSSGSSTFFRVVTPQGSLRNLTIPGLTGEDNYRYSSGWLRKLPDGRVYNYAAGQFGSTFSTPIFSYNESSNSFDSAPWIGPASMNSVNSYESFCSGRGSSAPVEFPRLCGGSGSWSSNGFTKQVTTGDNRVFDVSADGTVLQVYPRLDGFRSSLDKVSAAAAAGNRIILAGRVSDDYVLLSIDANTGQETVLIPAEAEIEVYNLQFSPGEGKVFFDGVRFGDNSYVFGSTAPSGGGFTADRATSGRWKEFQIFG